MSELEEKTAFKNKIESRTGTYHDKENDCKKGFQLPGSIISYLVLIKEGRKRKGKKEREEKGKERKRKSDSFTQKNMVFPVHTRIASTVNTPIKKK